MSSAGNGINHQYIVSALKAGFGTRQIAAGLGVTDSAVTQCIDEHGLKDLASQNSKFAEIDKKYNSLELTALQKLEKSLQYAALSPMQACNVIRTLNGAKRRSLAEGQNILNQNNVQLVQLNLPVRHKPKVTLSDRREIIEVNGRVLQTLPSGKLTEKTKETQKVLANEQRSELPLKGKSISEIL